jgi:1-acyl-sn-glycerol-3-phosphate acyltransferase
VFAVGIVVGSLLTLGFAADSFGRGMVRTWARVCLWGIGVRVRISGLEELERRDKRIVIFNHSSVLDLCVITSILPAGAFGVVKRELLFYPFIGWGMLFLNFLPIDRGNSERAHAALNRVGERIDREKLSVFIAPEGTRSRDGKLGPFKLGAFHLAWRARAPIVPIVVEGLQAVMPQGRWSANPGEVHLRILPPVATHDYDAKNLHAKADELRHLYERELKGEVPLRQAKA